MRFLPAMIDRASLSTEQGKLLAVFFAAILFQFANILLYRDYLFPDAIAELLAGHELWQTKAHVVLQSKVSWTAGLYYPMFQQAGMWGLKLGHLFFFLLQFLLLVALGKRAFPKMPGFLPAFLYSFYPGTILNVVANESADLVYALFLSLALLLFLRSKSVFVSTLIFGVGFLFKYIAGAFFLGFLAFLLLYRGLRDTCVAVFGMLLPFAIVSFVDPLVLQEFLAFFMANVSYSSWSALGFKLLSTGMLPAFAIGFFLYPQLASAEQRLFVLIPTGYLVYAVLAKNAFSANYIMSLAMVFLSFPISSFLVSPNYCGKFPALRTLLLGVYLLVSFVLVQMILPHSRIPVELDL